MPFDATQLGRNIERHRRRNGLTQIDLAYALTVTQSTVHNWEQGTSTPPLHRLYRLADVLGVNVIALLTETGAGGKDKTNSPDKANGNDKAVA
jgi:transcriptional regulator with XRE-family HTH domain